MTSKLALATLALLAQVSMAFAAQDFPIQGGAGDREDPLNCGKGSFIVGFKYRSGSWLDAIQPVCAGINNDGTVGARQPPLDERGGQGGAANEAYCPNNQIVHGIHFKLTVNNQVKWINVFCANLSLKKYQEFKIGNSGAGASEQANVIVQACGGDSYEAVRGITARTGRHVNAIGVHCRKKPVTGCLIGGVVRKDIVDSDCEEAQNTGCIRRLLTDQQYAACREAQKPKKPIKTTGNRPLPDRCNSHANLVAAVASKARGMNCAFLQQPGPWSQTRDQIVNACISSNGGVISTNMNAMIAGMKQCEGKDGGGNAARIKVLQPNKVYKEPTGEDTDDNTVCVLAAGDTADLVSKGADIGLDAHWVKIANASGGCAGKGGFVWNDGELQLP